MPIEPLLSFNGASAIVELGKAFDAVVESLCQTVMANAAANLGGQYPEAEASLKAQLLSLAQTGLIDGQIGSDHWTAWMAEWGSGSEMDQSNPDLSAYMASEYWNPVRDGFDITGRPEGPYLGLDGQAHDSKGTLAGVSLEKLMETDPGFRDWAESNIGPDAFKPRVPLHFMRIALESNRNLIMNQLNAVIETFGFGDFFV